MSIDWPMIVNYRPAKHTVITATGGLLGLALFVTVMVWAFAAPSVASRIEEGRRVAQLMVRQRELVVMKRAQTVTRP